MVGAKPVFVDICPRSYNIDPQRIQAAVTPKTKAILAARIIGILEDEGLSTRQAQARTGVPQADFSRASAKSAAVSYLSCPTRGGGWPVAYQSTSSDHSSRAW